jgi:hypothetical protein
LASFFNLFSLASGYYYYSLARVNYLYSLASGYCYYPLANGNNLFLWPVVIIFFSGQVYLLLSLGEEKGGGAGFTIISRCIRKKQYALGVRQQALKKKPHWIVPAGTSGFVRITIGSRQMRATIAEG